jgi:CDP-diacylglycerol--serine O-phosphatidyltransferase
MNKNRKRHIPNILTVLNMFLGFLAIGMLIKGDPVKAGWLILFAGVFDAVDGKIARLLGIPSRFGSEFDSFADTISFCVAPSVLIYTTYVQGLPPILGGLISFIPLLFGTIRLARFNVLQEEDPKPYFIGLTTPLNALFIFGYMLFSEKLSGNTGDPRIAILLVVIMGLLMISPVRFSKFPLISFRKGRRNTYRLLGVFILLISLIFLRGIVLFPLLSVYILWCVAAWVIHPHEIVDSMSIKNPSEREVF